MIWYSFQDGVVETILIEKDDTIKLENIEKVYDTYPPPDKNFKYEDPYVTDEEMRQLALERVIRMRVAKPRGPLRTSLKFIHKPLQ